MPKLFERLARKTGQATCFSVTCGGRRLFKTRKRRTTIPDRSMRSRRSTSSTGDPAGPQRDQPSGFRRLPARRPAAREKLRPCAKEFLLYETWGRKTNSETLVEHGWTNESMTFGIADAYQARRPACRRRSLTWALKFYAVGRQHPEIELYDPDRTHPSYAGSCLAAITLYTAIFGSYPAKLESLALPEDVRAAFRAPCFKPYGRKRSASAVCAVG